MTVDNFVLKKCTFYIINTIIPVGTHCVGLILMTISRGFDFSINLMPLLDFGKVADVFDKTAITVLTRELKCLFFFHWEVFYLPEGVKLFKEVVLLTFNSLQIDIISLGNALDWSNLVHYFFVLDIVLLEYRSNFIHGHSLKKRSIVASLRKILARE